MERYRLFNAVQTRIDLDGVSFDLRSDTVEITASDDGALVVLYRMFDRMNPNPMPDPICVGRVFIPGAAKVIKAIELDGQQWCVQSQFGTAIISPYQEEVIWSDPAFHEGITRNHRNVRLRELYDQHRSVLFAIMANQRFMRATPPELDQVRAMHQTTVEVMQQQLAAIEQRITRFRRRHGITAEDDSTGG
jgi:hypothetical protein